MADDKTFHLSTKAAEGYENQKVPSFFAPLARATLDAVSLPDNASVIDIACGTGVIAKTVADRLKGRGRIVGTDLNPAMIEVARRTMPETDHAVEWFSCDIAALPFEDGEFDIAFCQQGLQFFPDKPKALSEIARVVKPSGRLYLSCWRAESPLFQAVSASLKARINEDTARQALTPYVFRDGHLIASLIEAAGFVVNERVDIVVDRHLTPLRTAIREEMLAQPYEKALNDAGEATIEAIVDDVVTTLSEYRDGDSVTVPNDVQLFKATKSAAA
jgi:ubiquinone/menaquinone biosynthesis C-methylase UbiE